MQTPYADRTEAGRRLAEALGAWRGRDDVLVLALPRGGVEVAAEVAAALGAPLDVLVVRKLGAPGRPELAMGAIASGGVRVLNPDVVAALAVDEQTIEQVAAAEGRELERRERAYRGDRPRPALTGRQVVLVDDGLATGATMRAAVAAVRQSQPARTVVAVPVGCADTIAALRAQADEVVCPLVPAWLAAISQWYRHFPQLSDAEVCALLERARRDR